VEFVHDISMANSSKRERRRIGISTPHSEASSPFSLNFAPRVPDCPCKTRSGTPVVCAGGHRGGGSLPLRWPQARAVPDERVCSSCALPRDTLIELVVGCGLRLRIDGVRSTVLHLPQRRTARWHQTRRRSRLAQAVAGSAPADLANMNNIPIRRRRCFPVDRGKPWSSKKPDQAVSSGMILSSRLLAANSSAWRMSSGSSSGYSVMRSSHFG